MLYIFVHSSNILLQNLNDPNVQVYKKDNTLLHKVVLQVSDEGTLIHSRFF